MNVMMHNYGSSCARTWTWQYVILSATNTAVLKSTEVWYLALSETNRSCSISWLQYEMPSSTKMCEQHGERESTHTNTDPITALWPVSVCELESEASGRSDSSADLPLKRSCQTHSKQQKPISGHSTFWRQSDKSFAVVNLYTLKSKFTSLVLK